VVPAVAEPNSAPPAEVARAVEPTQPDDAPPAAPPATGSSPADSLRQNWNAVLDAVRQESRVAWVLLRNASVLSLESGILTLQFLREGEMKGFSVSGHDAVLKRVLSTGFGLNVIVKGVTGADRDSGAARTTGSAGPGPGPEPGPDSASRPPAAAQASTPRYHDEPPPEDQMPPEDPDEPADDQAPGVTELTGMDLIQRELGGQVIGEIED
jgi:DNA polymerase-3 subunit gamma/tau